MNAKFDESAILFKTLLPVMRFVLRVVRALPWRVGETFDDEVTERLFPSGALPGESEQILKTNHAELRQWLSSGDVTDIGGSYGEQHGWQEFPYAVAIGVLEAYASGEIALENTLKVVRRCALAFGDGVETKVVLYTMRRASLITPRKLKRRRPEVSSAVKCIAVTLVKILKAENPDQRLTPDDSTDWTTPILGAAIDWLVTLGVCDASKPVPPHTLYVWYRRHALSHPGFQPTILGPRPRRRPRSATTAPSMVRFSRSLRTSNRPL